MTKELLVKIRIYFVVVVTAGIWGLLIWNHFHGGILSHHILYQEDLPAISNWWGGLILPLLTLLLTYRIQKRIIRIDNELEHSKFPKSIIYGFVFALLYGLILSVFFINGYSNPAAYMTYGIFILALIFPIYRAECLLGFVIGMSYTFGAVLPTIVGSVFTLIGFILYKFVRGGVLYLIRKVLSLK